MGGERGGPAYKNQQTGGASESKQRQILELYVPYDLQTHWVIHSKGLFVFRLSVIGPGCNNWQHATDRLTVHKKSRFSACTGVKYETGRGCKLQQPEPGCERAVCSGVRSHTGWSLHGLLPTSFTLHCCGNNENREKVSRFKKLLSTHKWHDYKSSTLFSE